MNLPTNMNGASIAPNLAGNLFSELKLKIASFSDFPEVKV
jgi:hypothetical protein